MKRDPDPWDQGACVSRFHRDRLAVSLDEGNDIQPERVFAVVPAARTRFHASGPSTHHDFPHWVQVSFSSSYAPSVDSQCRRRTGPPHWGHGSSDSSSEVNSPSDSSIGSVCMRFLSSASFERFSQFSAVEPHDHAIREVDRDERAGCEDEDPGHEQEIGHRGASSALSLYVEWVVQT